MQTGRQRWGTGALVAGGAVVVAAVVALVLPESTFDASSTTGQVLSSASIPDPLDIRTTGPSVVQVGKLTFPPDSQGPWHSHQGDVLVSVLSGTATMYDGDDPACRPQRFPAGTGMAEHPGHVHIVRNEGSDPLVLYVVWMTPSGKDSDVDRPRNGNCPF